MKGTLALLFLLFCWVSEPAAAEGLNTDTASEAGDWTENGNEIQNYNTQTVPLVCQLSTCELLLKELGAMQEKIGIMEAKLEAHKNEIEELKEEKRATNAGDGTENEIQNYNTQTAPLVCQLSTCELLLKELGAMQEKMRAMETRLQASETEAEVRAEIMEAELQALKNEIEKLKEENRVNVAFSASVGYHGSTGPYNVEKTLVYKNIITNIGNAYNPASGIFTAPVTGTYFFSFYYHASTHNRGSLSLKKNGQTLASTSHHKVNSGTDNGSNGVTVQMEMGEQVYVILNSNAWVYDSVHHDTIFSGFLISTV